MVTINDNQKRVIILFIGVFIIVAVVLTIYDGNQIAMYAEKSNIFCQKYGYEYSNYHKNTDYTVNCCTNDTCTDINSNIKPVDKQIFNDNIEFPLI